MPLNYPTIRPSLVLDFANSRTVDPRITFTRASTATYFDRLGVMRTAAANEPRIDFDPATLACRGLLIEAPRQNLLLYSQEFNNAEWAKLNVILTADAATAPDGSQTADLIVANTTDGQHFCDSNTSGTYTDGTKYAFSVFVKAAGSVYAAIANFYAAGATEGVYSVFNLQTGTVHASTAESAKITPLPGGWFRISHVVTVNSAATYPNSLMSRVAVPSPTGSLLQYTGDGTSGLYIWGAQLEQENAPTSYIPTTSSQVTCAADVATMTGANFSSWYRQDEGTVFVDLAPGDFSATSRGLWAVGDPTLAFEVRNSFYAAVEPYSGGTFKVSAAISGSEQLGFPAAPGTFAVGAFAKTAFAYQQNNSAAALNGTAGSTDTNCSVPTGSNFGLSIGCLAQAWNGGANYLNGHIRRIAYWPKRLPNAMLQALTA